MKWNKNTCNTLNLFLLHLIVASSSLCIITTPCFINFNISIEYFVNLILKKNDNFFTLLDLTLLFFTLHCEISWNYFILFHPGPYSLLTQGPIAHPSYPKGIEWRRSLPYTYRASYEFDWKDRIKKENRRLNNEG